jgi:hypothetical protein
LERSQTLVRVSSWRQAEIRFVGHATAFLQQVGGFKCVHRNVNAGTNQCRRNGFAGDLFESTNNLKRRLTNFDHVSDLDGEL